MQSDQYWELRATKRMVDYMNEAERVSDEIAKKYYQATEYITQESQNIFSTFSKGISESEARRLLNDIQPKETLQRLKQAIGGIKDEKLKADMLKQINAPAYRARIARLEAMSHKLDKICKDIAKAEYGIAKSFYIDTAKTAYYRTIFDIKKGTGYDFNFAKIPKKRINEIVSNNWSGEHYSERIWANTQQLSEVLQNELSVGLISGKSQKYIAEMIAERMGVGASNARRLVRTETCYIANQGELQSYAECGIDKYKFVATLDGRTSTLCQEKDGNVYQLKDAKIGVNMPPLHVYCRSTTIAVIDGTTETNLKRRAKNPITGKSEIVDNIPYKEWIKQYQ